jgi:hypothetical protein
MAMPSIAGMARPFASLKAIQSSRADCNSAGAAASVAVPAQTPGSCGISPYQMRICSPAHDRPSGKSGWISFSCGPMGRDALAELRREQLIELVLALAAEVAELKARQGQPPKAPGNSSFCRRWGSRRIGLSVGRISGAGTFWLRRLLRGQSGRPAAPA